MTVKYDDVINQLDSKNIRGILLILATIVALGGFLFGYDTGIAGTTLVYVKPLFHLTPYQISWLVSGTSLVAGIGALVAGPLVDKFGRKSLLLADGAIYLIFAILAAIARNAIELILWRSIIGFAIGADTAIAAGFIAEFSPTRKRGLLVAMQQDMTFAGMLTAFWVGYFLAIYLPPTINWRWMLGAGAIPALILFIFRTTLPESPRWLLIHGKVEQAIRSFKRLGVEVKDTIEAPIKDASYRQLFRNRTVLKIIAIGSILLMFQQITGVNIALYYGPYIYTYIGLSGSRAILNTAISEIFGIIGYTLATIYVDKLGRKNMGLLGYSGMAVGMAIIVAGIYMFNLKALITAAWTIFIGATLFLFMFKFSGVVGVVISGETVPTEFRGRGQGTMWAVDWFSNYAIIMIFPLWTAAYGPFTFFILEVILCILAVIYIYKWLPETAGIRVEHMEELFSKKKGASS